MQQQQQQHDNMRAPGIYHLEDLESKCSLWRYRCSVMDIEELEHINSKYSPEFTVAGVQWRVHLQQRVDTQQQRVYIAVHLQCLTQSPQGTYGHFKLSICNVNPDLTKAKNFHCHFRKSGSAWGLHHFVLKDKLLEPDGGFIDYGIDDMPSEFGGVHGSHPSPARQPGKSAIPCVAIDILLRVIDAGPDGQYVLGHLPRSNKSAAAAGGGSSSLLYAAGAADMSQRQQQQQDQQQQGRSASAQHQAAAAAAAAHEVQAQLQFPYDDALCDMKFTVDGQVVPAHRCIIWCRAPKLLGNTDGGGGGGDGDASGSSVRQGETVNVALMSLDVFQALIRYVYTEEPPERGFLKADGLLDLYAAAMEHEFFLLAEHCINYVFPMLNYDNILSLIEHRYNPADEQLTNLYLRILVSGYDQLIEDKKFENLHGTLNRRLSLIIRGKERTPTIAFPKMRNTLSAQLGNLAQNPLYSDYDISIPDANTTNNTMAIKAHRFVLLSRSVVYSNAFAQRGGAQLPSFTSTQDFNFSARAWQKFFASLYRATLYDAQQELSAEDVAIAWKLNDTLALDGRLRRESDPFVTPPNALRLLVFSEKHNIPKLKEVSMVLVASNFPQRVRNDPGIWDIIAELPQQSLLSLFRTVVTEMR